MLITSETITDPAEREKKARLEEIGRIIRMPVGTEKLQAVAALWMSDPRNGAENRRQMVECAKYCQEIRDTRLNDFASSEDKNSSLRMQFSPPAGLMLAIEHFFNGADPWGGVEGRANWSIFKKAFPQFMTARRY